MEFDHELFDVVQTSWTGKYSVKRRPLRALDVNLQNVDRSLYNVQQKISKADREGR